MIIYNLRLGFQIHDKQALFFKHINLTDVDLFYTDSKWAYNLKRSQNREQWAGLDYIPKLVTLRKL